MRYQFREAFALMLYRCEKTGDLEWLWNSRDGITPYCIGKPDGSGEMRHVDWFRDVEARYFVPAVGSRVFVALTEDRARARKL